MYYSYLTGRNRTGSEPTGTLIHAIDSDGSYYPSFGQAVCGAEPGMRSNGWSSHRFDNATCPKCIKKLQQKEEIRMATLLRPFAANFVLDIVSEVLAKDEHTVFAGYHLPREHWNGFATPMFTKEEALRLTEALNKVYKLLGPESWHAWTLYNENGDYAWYDESRDCFVNYSDMDEDGTLEEWKAAEVMIDGVPTKTYAIGSYCWTWSVYDNREEEEAEEIATGQSWEFEQAVDNMEVHPDDFEWASDAWGPKGLPDQER